MVIDYVKKQLQHDRVYHDYSIYHNVMRGHLLPEGIQCHETTQTLLLCHGQKIMYQGVQPSWGYKK